jgi:hypothetical protein
VNIDWSPKPRAEFAELIKDIVPAVPNVVVNVVAPNTGSE